jgi:hypothetical protein
MTLIGYRSELLFKSWRYRIASGVLYIFCFESLWVLYSIFDFLVPSYLVRHPRNSKYRIYVIHLHNFIFIFLWEFAKDF